MCTDIIAMGFESFHSFTNRQFRMGDPRRDARLVTKLKALLQVCAHVEGFVVVCFLNLLLCSILLNNLFDFRKKSFNFI